LRSGIGPRLLASVLLFSSAITLFLTLLQLYLDYRRDVGTIENRMSAIERSYLPSLGKGLWNLDAQQLELQVDGILHLPAIRFVEVREATDRPDPTRSCSDRPSLSTDHAATKSILRRVTALQSRSKAGRLSRPLAPLTPLSTNSSTTRHPRCIAASIRACRWFSTV
jgi:hypothetical protein